MNEKKVKDYHKKKISIKEKRVLYLKNRKNLGSIHPITKIIWEIEDIFLNLGFKIVFSPEIENKNYNFDKLEIPLDHPARSKRDTFYFEKNNLLLRTHTSNTEVRILEKNKNKEIGFITFGKTYRRDEDDDTHTHQFTQMEVTKVGKNINFLDLKNIIIFFLKELFGNECRMRFRSSYFPFTEPSIEVDLECIRCLNKKKKDNNACSICKNTNWIEILGGGLLREKILKNCGYDKDKFTAFAFGMGIERIVMIKYGLKDIRELYNNNVKFLRQFGS